MKIKILLLLFLVLLPAMHASFDLDGGDKATIGILMMVLFYAFLMWFEERLRDLYRPSDIKNFTSDSDFNHAKTWSGTPKYLTDPWFALLTEPNVIRRNVEFRQIFCRDASKIYGSFYVGDLPDIFNCKTEADADQRLLGRDFNFLTVFCFENKNTPCKYNIIRKKDSPDDSRIGNSSTTFYKIKESVRADMHHHYQKKRLKFHTDNEQFNNKIEPDSDNLETFKKFLTVKKIEMLLKLDNTTVIEATPKVTLFYDWPKIVDITELKDKYSYFEDIHKILDCY